MNLFKKIIAIILTIDLIFVSSAFTSFAENSDESETVVTTVATTEAESETTTVVSETETGEKTSASIEEESSDTSTEEEENSSASTEEPENDGESTSSLNDENTTIENTTNNSDNEQVASASEIVEEEIEVISTNSVAIKNDDETFGIDELEWTFSTFGNGVNTTNNGHNGEYADGTVEVFSTNKKGKLVPASTDGLAFYYTKINPTTKNFKLSADAEVISWNLSNGQDGFGLMACDRVGVNGDSTTFWNNSYFKYYDYT